VKLDSKVQAGLEQASKQLFSAHADDPNFTGCGIGFRRRDGKVTSELAVIAMVVNKLPAGAVSRRRLLPATVAGGGRDWGVDVVEVGMVTPCGPARARKPAKFSQPARAHAAVGAAPEAVPAAGPLAATVVTADVIRPDAFAFGGPITDRMRPPLQGCSISNLNAVESDNGTLGCYLKDDGIEEGKYILSTNYVLARVNQAAVDPGESIIQPAAVDGGTNLDEVAFVFGFAPLVQGGTVDAAVALMDPDQNFSEDVAGGLMARISADHPAVGMVVASDWQSNSFLCRMDNVLSQLNDALGNGLSLIPASESQSCVVAPEVGMIMEKVGRTSGYSSCPVDAIGVHVKVNYFADNAQDSTVIVLTDMIWTQFFSASGDEGAVACQGGNGRTFVLPPTAACPVLSAVESYYGVPATNDNTLTNQIQSKFLTQSACGNLLIGLVYLNAQVVIDRLQADQGPGFNQAAAQTVMQQFYAQYRGLIAAQIASPDPNTVITEQNLEDLQPIMTEIGAAPPDGQGLLTYDEALAMVRIYLGVAAETIGMNYFQLINYMNDPGVYNNVFGILAQVPTIKLP
jgi:hypothetical protein